MNSHPSWVGGGGEVYLEGLGNRGASFPSSFWPGCSSCQEHLSRRTIKNVLEAA